MTNARVSSADTTNMAGTVTSVTVDPVAQDRPETRYSPDWNTWYGYYKVIPELQAVVDKKAIWTIGRGIKVKDKNKKLLVDKVRGCGKDTFDSILFNLCRSYTIGGDSFAEIVRNDRAELINLKPLNPGSITVIADAKGIIQKYVQLDVKGAEAASWKPEQMLHLAWNRLGDECHGHSTVEKLEQIILARNEAMSDMKIVFHRYVKPVIVSEADTDDPVQIGKLKAKLDKAVQDGENIIIPKGSVSMTRMSIPQYSTLDPLPWMKFLTEFFIMAEGVPMEVLGAAGGSTEANGKTKYLAFQQVVEHNQLFIEQQVKAQLGIDIELEFPASLEQDAQQNVAKSHKGMNDGTGGMQDGRTGSNKTNSGNIGKRAGAA